MNKGAIDQVRYWSEEEFAASGEVWEELLGRSDSDPLFMSWNWQWLWWRHHKELLEAELAVVACYAGSLLVGLAPLLRRRASVRAGLQATRLELIGTTFRDGRGVFSEYLDLIADREHTGSVAGAIAAHLRNDRRWSELVVGNSPACGVAAAMVRNHLSHGCVVREVDALEAHRSDLPQDFAEYARSLSGGIRRKVVNHRSKLVDPQFVVAGPGEIVEILDRIDAFHVERWNAPQYVGVARAFHSDLAAALAERGALRMSTLISDGAPLAVMYNVRLSGTEYNIQSGFDASRAVGMSPGYLHFGYSIEDACHDGLSRFDFLAGQGRSRQYKQDFQTTEFPLVTFQVIRSRALRLLYRAHRILVGSGS